MMLPITESYVQLKIDELQVTQEHREHKKQERDRLAELRSNKRQEARLRQDIYDAELEEKRWQSKLNEVRASAGDDTDTKLRQRIEELEQLLAEAHERTERAKSMAELTSTGFVSSASGADCLRLLLACLWLTVLPLVATRTAMR